MRCPYCHDLVDSDKEWRRVDDNHIKIMYFCDRCGEHIEEEDEIVEQPLFDWEKSKQIRRKQKQLINGF